MAIVAGFWVLCPAARSAEDHPSYQSLIAAVTSEKDCTSQDQVDLVIFVCEKSQALWYFTKPSHPAHPGVVKRYVVEGGEGVSIAERGWSFAPDAAQPAFKTLLAQISALDIQARDAMAEQHGGPPVLDRAVHIYGNWQATTGDSASVASLTRRYFSLVDGRHYDDAYALLDASLTAMLPYAEYVALADRRIADIGTIKNRTIKTIDWGKDSPNGPPGIYAALDYSADAEKGQICGFVAWRRQPDGFYVLVREETNIIPATVAPAEIAALKAEFRCVP